MFNPSSIKALFFDVFGTVVDWRSSLIADFTLPILWGFVATIPLLLISWWIAYRSEWFG